MLGGWGDGHSLVAKLEDARVEEILCVGRREVRLPVDLWIDNNRSDWLPGCLTD